MPLETGTYINSLVSSNPASTDGIDKADDHLRLLKSTLLATFPNIEGAVSLSHTEINQGAVPSGVIVMWSGSVGTIPSGWQLCDGTNGTPDLRNRFVVGAGSTYAVAAMGGAATDSITTSAAGSHSHTAQASGSHTHGGSTGTHALTIAEMPSHGHPTYVSSSSSDGGDSTGGIALRTGSSSVRAAYVGTPGAPAGQQVGGAGGGGSHSHSISGSGTHTHTTTTEAAHTHTATVDTLPPYYALAYIMRL